MGALRTLVAVSHSFALLQVVRGEVENGEQMHMQICAVCLNFKLMLDASAAASACQRLKNQIEIDGGPADVGSCRVGIRPLRDYAH